VHEGMHARVAKPEPGGPLIVDGHGSGDGAQVVFTNQAVVAQRFDV